MSACALSMPPASGPGVSKPTYSTSPRVSVLPRLESGLEALEGQVDRHYYPPQQFIEKAFDLKLDPWQVQYLAAAPKETRIGLVACRQSGKSTVTGGYVAWNLMYVPGTMVLIGSKSLRQAAHYLGKVTQAVTKFIPRSELPIANQLSITLPNGNQAISIPSQTPDTARGYSPSLVILDEAAFAPEQMLGVITPSLAATHGALHMLSSANGPSGFFYEAVEGSTAKHHWSLKITADHCPRITKEFLEVEKTILGVVRYRSEYWSEFLAAEGAFFGYSGLQALFAGSTPDLKDLENLVENDEFPDEEHYRPTMRELKGVLDTAEYASKADRYLYS